MIDVLQQEAPGKLAGASKPKSLHATINEQYLGRVNKKLYLIQVDQSRQSFQGGLVDPLPVLHLNDNVLFVDGKYCERAKIDKKSVAWSRRVKEGVFSGHWEHGLCAMSGLLAVAGQGYIFRSKDAQPKVALPIQKRIRFVASVNKKRTQAHRSSSPSEPTTRVQAQALATRLSKTSVKPGDSSSSAVVGDDDESNTFTVTYGPDTKPESPPTIALFDIVTTSTPPNEGGLAIPVIQIPPMD